MKLTPEAWISRIQDPYPPPRCRLAECVCCPQSQKLSGGVVKSHTQPQVISGGFPLWRKWWIDMHLLRLPVDAGFQVACPEGTCVSSGRGDKVPQPGGHNSRFYLLPVLESGCWQRWFPLRPSSPCVSTWASLVAWVGRREEVARQL